MIGLFSLPLRDSYLADCTSCPLGGTSLLPTLGIHIDEFGQVAALTGEHYTRLGSCLMPP